MGEKNLWTSQVLALPGQFSKAVFRLQGRFIASSVSIEKMVEIV